MKTTLSKIKLNSFQASHMAKFKLTYTVDAVLIYTQNLDSISRDSAG